jgi:hypothetical protein
MRQTRETLFFLSVFLLRTRRIIRALKVFKKVRQKFFNSIPVVKSKFKDLFGNICAIYVELIHRKKKVREFPVPSRDVTTKLSLGGNNDVITELFLPRGSLVSDIPAGGGKLVNLFLRCR